MKHITDICKDGLDGLLITSDVSTFWLSLTSLKCFWILRIFITLEALPFSSVSRGSASPPIHVCLNGNQILAVKYLNTCVSLR